MTDFIRGLLHTDAAGSSIVTDALPMKFARLRAWARIGLAILVPCLLLLAPGRPAAATPDAAAGAALIEALRAGGYNIYFRHVATDWSQSDDLRAAEDWLSCDPARMRQLSAAGRAAAKAIGAAIRRLQIPVGEVLASPYCRTLDTARLMDLGPVTSSTDVMNLRAADYFGGRAKIVATARALLARPPPAGSNRIIVAHGNVAREATPVYPGEGEGVVFRPEDDGGFRLIGRITPAQWAQLASAVAD